MPLFVVIFEIIFYLACSIILLASIIKGAPFLPTENSAVDAMLKFLRPNPGTKAADLGSGDGRIVIALAKLGIEAHGYEINPILVLISRWKIKRAGLQNKAFIHWKSFWNEDFSQFSSLTLFGIPYIMERLETKLKKELKPGSRIASNAFGFPHLPLAEKQGKIYCYEIA